MKPKNDETYNNEKRKNHLYCNSMIVGKEKEEMTLKVLDVLHFSE